MMAASGSRYRKGLLAIILLSGLTGPFTGTRAFAQAEITAGCG